MNPPVINTGTFVMVIRMLAIMCSSCPDLAVILLKQSKFWFVMVIRMLAIMCSSCPDLAVILLKQSKFWFVMVIRMLAKMCSSCPDLLINVTWLRTRSRARRWWTLIAKELFMQPAWKISPMHLALYCLDFIFQNPKAGGDQYKGL